MIHFLKKKCPFNNCLVFDWIRCGIVLVSKPKTMSLPNYGYNEQRPPMNQLASGKAAGLKEHHQAVSISCSENKCVIYRMFHF